MIDIIGAPFDLCGMRHGSRLGPPAMRLAGLKESLQSLGLKVQDSGDISAQCTPADGEGLRNFKPLMQALTALKERVDHSLDDGHVPLVLGGEHTLSIAGVCAALERFGDGLALLWIDAHADINTPGTSPSGNLHGMPIALMQRLPSGVDGLADAQWREMMQLVQERPLRPDRTAWYALREVDSEERPRVQGLAITMFHVDRYGVDATVKRFDDWMRASGAKHLWISFDVDALDPILAPGTGTTVRGGLSYRESHLCAELIRDALDAPDCPYRLVGLDVVEVNPLYDNMNETAKMAVEWIASLFGKTILGVQ